MSVTTYYVRFYYESKYFYNKMYIKQPKLIKLSGYTWFYKKNVIISVSLQRKGIMIRVLNNIYLLNIWDNLQSCWKLVRYQFLCGVDKMECQIDMAGMPDP